MKNKYNVLVVIDVQNDFITGSLANKEAQKKVSNIVKKISEFNGDAIFVTRDTHDENYLETPEGKKLPIAHCIDGTWGWEIEDTVKEALISAEARGINVEYINKPTFGSCELPSDIISVITNDEPSDEDKVNMDIEICGFCTDICVVSNALIIKALTYDFAEITVDASCCAGVTVESHNAALTTMRSCQINVIGE